VGEDAELGISVFPLWAGRVLAGTPWFATLG
jgi:hypothetical protein